MQENIPTDKVDISHHLQRQVLVKLRRDGPASYQQLKPDGVEGNAYNYHLRNLKKSGLITHEDSLYTLTPTGFLVVDAFSLQSQRLMLRPHVYTVLLVTSGESMLLYEHARSPLMGRLSLLSGKLHYGDDFKASIAREAQRRQLSSEYQATELCPFNVRYEKEEKVLLHRSGVLWHLAYEGPLATRTTANGISRWVPFGELDTVLGCLPEVHEGLGRLKSGHRQPIDMTSVI